MLRTISHSPRSVVECTVKLQYFHTGLAEIRSRALEVEWVRVDKILSTRSELRKVTVVLEDLLD